MVIDFLELIFATKKQKTNKQKQKAKQKYNINKKEGRRTSQHQIAIHLFSNIHITCLHTLRHQMLAPFERYSSKVSLSQARESRAFLRPLEQTLGDVKAWCSEVEDRPVRQLELLDRDVPHGDPGLSDSKHRLFQIADYSPLERKFVEKMKEKEREKEERERECVCVENGKGKKKMKKQKKKKKKKKKRRKKKKEEERRKKTRAKKERSQKNEEGFKKKTPFHELVVRRCDIRQGESFVHDLVIHHLPLQAIACGHLALAENRFLSNCIQHLPCHPCAPHTWNDATS